MAWIPAVEYKARIGGILYRNVAQPIVCNGKSLISLVRNTETEQLAVSLELVHQDGSVIASVVNNAVILHNSSDYAIHQGLNRTAVIEKKTGRIWCDLRRTSDSEYEMAISCLLFSESGYPIVLHPDRSKFGTVNENHPPNIAFLTLTTDPGNNAPCIALGNGPLYLLGIAIENFRTGIQITLLEDNEPH